MIYNYKDIIPDSSTLNVKMPQYFGANFIDYTYKEDNSIDFNFSASLTADEQSNLSEIVINNKAPKKDYKIYEYINYYDGDLHKWPEDINYITSLSMRLQPDAQRQYGETVDITYYSEEIDNGDGTFTYNNPIVKETYEYIRDPATNFPVTKTQKIQWYFSDGTLDVRSKYRVKSYKNDISSSINDLIRTRDTNISDIISVLIPCILITDPAFITKSDVIQEGRRFFELYSFERSLYISDSSTALEDAIRLQDASISTGDFQWLDNDISAIVPGTTTMRNLCIERLSRGVRLS